MQPWWAAQFFDPFKIPNLPPRRAGEYLPERLADECISFIRTNQSRPFFLCWWDYAVHYPIQAPAHLIEKYRQRAGITNAAYAAMIEGFDLAIGRVLRELDALALADHTLILFTSDNGSLFDNQRCAPTRASCMKGASACPGSCAGRAS